ncbi:hypothetical protein KC959_00435 [Candidatus Saccharibacteria bacterium]|nr:hypothetical protein [Candidatus Saccharibacteria bacterium]
MNDLEDKLRAKNPKLTKREGFVDAVMTALPDQPLAKSRLRKWASIWQFSAGVGIAAATTFGLLALFVLPNVRSAHTQSPEVSRDTGEQVVANVEPVSDTTLTEQDFLEPIALEQEATNLESEVNDLENEATQLENDLSDEMLGLN